MCAQCDNYEFSGTQVFAENIREGVDQLTRLLRDLSADQIQYLDPDDPTLLNAGNLREMKSNWKV